MQNTDILPEVPEFIKEGYPVFEWVEYKGKSYFAAMNYEKSVLKNKLVLDLHYCATAALNNALIEKTVLYNKKHFTKPIEL